MNLKSLMLVMGLAIGGAGHVAYATNGMLMEGYGPISEGMGGAAMAFDNGAGAMANNPATLGLMPEGNRVDIAVGYMAPDVKIHMGGQEIKSDADKFFMPAIGYVRKQGQLAYGIGVYSQGGMGTDFMDSMNMYSQVIMGKVIVPVAYRVNEQLTVGATLEYVWAGMDLVMGPFNFKNGSDFSGSATASGISGKIGVTYKINDIITMGAVYQLKGNLGDLTGRGARVEGMDLPATLGLGFSAQITNKLMIAADYKRIFWSDSMNTVTISQNGITMGMPQNWKDQNVLAIGLAYQVTPQLTLRAGANIANNPIESQYLVPLFPAIVKNHYTAGFGYRFNEMHSMDASLAYAPKITENNGLDFAGTSSSHSQTVIQLMYSVRF